MSKSLECEDDLHFSYDHTYVEERGVCVLSHGLLGIDLFPKIAVVVTIQGD